MESDFILLAEHRFCMPSVSGQNRSRNPFRICPASESVPVEVPTFETGIIGIPQHLEDGVHRRIISEQSKIFFNIPWPSLQFSSISFHINHFLQNVRVTPNRKSSPLLRNTELFFHPDNPFWVSMKMLRMTKKEKYRIFYENRLSRRPRTGKT